MGPWPTLGVWNVTFCVSEFHLDHVQYHLELRLGIGDRHGGTGGDVHMGQDTIDELDILAWR